MPTKDYKDLIKERAARDPEFCDSLFCEAVDMWLSGDIETSKVLLRDYVDESVGFKILAKKMKKTPKTLKHMLSEEGSPRANSLYNMIVCLKQYKDVSFLLAHNDDLYV